MLTIVSFLFTAGCGSSAGPDTTGAVSGSITGVVATRGAGITVEAQRDDGTSRITTADAEGRYTFDGLIPGRYRLFASAPGYSRSPVDGTVEVVAGRTTTAGRIVLNWTGIGVPTATLNGTILDVGTGLPVEGVFVNVACDPNEIICLGRSAFTDAQGRYTIPSIPPGFGFDLFIGKTDYSNHLERGHLLEPHQIQTLDIQIRRE